MNSSNQSADVARVLVVDDHPVFRLGVCQLLDVEEEFRVVATAAHLDEALSALRETQPEIAIVDIVLPGTDGYGVVRALKHEQPSLRVLMLSMHEEPEFAVRALRAGAQGFVSKGDAVRELVLAARTVRSGEIYINEGLRNQLLFRAWQAEEMDSKSSPLERLTPRERQLLEVMESTTESRAIARELSLSVKTVETHRSNICAKLGIRSSAELTKFVKGWAARHQ